MMIVQEGGTTRGREGIATRGNATASLRKTTRGRRSERVTRDVSSGNDKCSDDSNNNSDSDADSGDSDSSDNNSKRDSGGSDSNSGRKNNN